MATRSKKLDQVESVESPVESVEAAEMSIDLTNESVVKQIEEYVETGMLKFYEWKYLKPSITELNTSSIQEMIEYCQSIIEGRKKTEVAELEAQMREIQSKLIAIKGTKSSNSEERVKREVTKAYNPNNPNQYYTVGKHPDWLKELLIPANGDRERERDIMNSLRRKETEE